jgi:hypothetical protein
MRYRCVSPGLFLLLGACAGSKPTAPPPPAAPVTPVASAAGAPAAAVGPRPPTARVEHTDASSIWRLGERPGR